MQVPQASHCPGLLSIRRTCELDGGRAQVRAYYQSERKDRREHDYGIQRSNVTHLYAICKYNENDLSVDVRNMLGQTDGRYGWYKIDYHGQHG